MKTIEVVAAIIHREGEVLATQRGYGEWKGWWEFPGGKVEANEAFEDALKREIREELGVDISIDRLLCTTEYDYPTFHLMMHSYICAIASGSIVLNEHSSAKWLSKEKLHTVEWLPADTEVVTYIENNPY